MSFYADLIKWKVSFGGNPVVASDGTFDALTVTSLTAGSVVFSGAGGTIAQDNANLFWDNTNNWLGIGTASPTSLLTTSVNTSTVLPYIVLNNAGGFAAGEPAIDWFSAPGALTTARVSSLPGAGYTNSAMIFSVANPTKALTERMRIDVLGNVGIGTAAPTAALHLKPGTAAANTAPLKLTSGVLTATPEAGSEEFLNNDRYYTGTDGTRRRYAVNSEVIRFKGFTVATLPAGTQGDSAFVTDALTPAYLATVAGGGTVVTPVFYNGTAWVCT